ncbi:tyrosine-type recombinase/integrase [Methylobacterium gregans]|uniref:tyrosine-type recombinase/integrase n=1 Tax=Methylobacterium gregans TaxID=374424 RepID=UPI003605F82E
MLAYVAKLLEFWGDKPVAAIKGASCRDYVTWRTSQPLKAARKGPAKEKRVSVATDRRDLEVLRAAVNLYHAEYTLAAVPKVTLPEKAVARERWLTRHEAARGLARLHLGSARPPVEAGRGRSPDSAGPGDAHAARPHPPLHPDRDLHRHPARGDRTPAVSPEHDRRLVRSRARSDLPARGGERETRKRRQPEKVAHRLVPHLTRWAASDAEHGVLHVIHTSSGDSLSTPIRTGWRGCLRNAGLDAKVVPHVMRHTAATWLMQAGVDVWEAADMLGMMMETLHGTYERQHPDFQDGAAGAFRGKR